MQFKHSLLLAATLLTASLTSRAQTQAGEKPYIEVTGTAEKEVVPDQIYITITLAERYDGRTKVTIDDQERQLKDLVKKLGIDMADLSVADANASYVRINWLNKDVLARKNYSLKVGTAEIVSRVFQGLAEINIKDVSVDRVDYSRKEELKKELRIAAVKDAKDKATYMLEAAGQMVGKPLYIHEQEAGGPITYAMRVAAPAVAVPNGSDTATDNGDYLEFKKTKYTMNVDTRFEIK